MQTWDRTDSDRHHGRAKIILPCQFGYVQKFTYWGLRGIGPLSHGLIKPALYQLSIHRINFLKSWRGGFEPSTHKFCKLIALHLCSFPFYSICLRSGVEPRNIIHYERYILSIKLAEEINYRIQDDMDSNLHKKISLSPNQILLPITLTSN